MAISILGIINALSPKDFGSSKVAGNVPYGPAARQMFDVYAPIDAVGPLPVVFFVYGGSWMDGSRHDYDFVGRAIAAQGFVTIIADYRLLPEIEYPAFLHDCAAAFEHGLKVVAEYGGDPARVGLAGHSAGAYNAAMLAFDPQYLRALGLLSRVKALALLSGPYDFFPFDGRITLRTFGAVRQPQTTQPVNLVQGDAPPAWLATGGKDHLVYPRNTVALARRLRASGVPVTERHYEALGHPGTLLALARPWRRRAPVLAEMTEFLRRALG